MILFVKFMVGGILILIIDYLSKLKDYYYISALIPLFPTFGIITILSVWFKWHDISFVRNTILFGIFSLIPYFNFLISLYILLEKANIIISLTLSIFIWFITSYILINMWDHLGK